MRPARVLNLFISSILPPSHVQKLPSKLPWTCLGCGRFKWKPFRSLSSYSKVSTAEPCISIIKLAQQGRSQEALVMYLKLVEEERRPSQEALYQLAQTLYKSNHLVGMQALHNTLFIHPLSDRTRRSLIYVHIMFINLIARTTRDMQAIQQLCELVSDSVKAGNPVIYNTLIKVFLENGERLKAEQAYEKLKQNGKPTIVTFDIWMKEAERQKDYKAMIYYLDEMNYFGVSPDRRMVFRVTEKAFQKQAGIFQNSKDAKKRNQRWFKEVGNGFKTPKEAKVGTYIDKKCPFVGEVNIQGRILTGVVVSTKMNRTLVVRRDYLHYIPKYNRYEKRHSNVSAHVSPAFDNQAIQV
ncbi:hypothetical protein CU098_012922 [Rhizopus stolonifer]|uniref:Small ribosomal subunit protein uS17 n=1 Tax=Rhizopus stolonifer TaxID=4846 RepID=A0A367KQQ1_RHIST|nr:hypothetical protein CU098_012922 [Rhizopus stolonifer]